MSDILPTCFCTPKQINDEYLVRDEKTTVHWFLERRINKAICTGQRFCGLASQKGRMRLYISVFRQWNFCNYSLMSTGIFVWRSKFHWSKQDIQLNTWHSAFIEINAHAGCKVWKTLPRVLPFHLIINSAPLKLMKVFLKLLFCHSPLRYLFFFPVELSQNKFKPLY